MRFALALLLVFAALPAAAQISPPVPCVTVGTDGRTGPPGFFFVSIMEGRVVTMIVRTREGSTDVTDFRPLTIRNGTSYFHENFDVRVGERARSQFMLATVRDDGTILMEVWDRTNPRPSEFSFYFLRCTG